MGMPDGDKERNVVNHVLQRDQLSRLCVSCGLFLGMSVTQSLSRLTSQRRVTVE